MHTDSECVSLGACSARPLAHQRPPRVQDDCAVAWRSPARQSLL